jgi:hypothetical protein
MLHDTGADHVEVALARLAQPASPATPVTGETQQEGLLATTVRA